MNLRPNGRGGVKETSGYSGVLILMFLFCCPWFLPRLGPPCAPLPPFGSGSPGAAPLASCSLLPLLLSLSALRVCLPPGFPGLALLGFRVGAVDSGFLLWILSRFSWCWAFGSSQVACKFVTQRSLLSKKTKLILNQRFAKVRQGLLTNPPD